MQHEHSIHTYVCAGGCMGVSGSGTRSQQCSNWLQVGLCKTPGSGRKPWTWADVLRAEYCSFVYCPPPPPPLPFRLGCNCCEAEYMKIRAKHHLFFLYAAVILPEEGFGKSRRRVGGCFLDKYDACAPSMAVHFFLVSTQRHNGDGVMGCWEEMTRIRLSA